MQVLNVDKVYRVYSPATPPDENTWSISILQWSFRQQQSNHVIL